MKRNRSKIGRLSLFAASVVALMACVSMIHSCADEIEGTAAGHNFSMAFSDTRAGEVSAADLIPNMRLFTFDQTSKLFKKEVLNIARTSTQLSAKIETGTWDMAMVSSPENVTLIPPTSTPAKAMGALPMYVYQPTVSGGKSTSMPEIFFQNQITPAITANTTQTMDAQLNRVAAKVQIVIDKATPNFNLSSTTHKIYLHDVPSTISYTGKLLPSAANPTLLAAPLEASVTLHTSTTKPGFLESTQIIEFIIPAHQGTDFLATNPADVIAKRMSVSVDLERTGGTRFTKKVEVDKVALCNRILCIYINVNDGIAINTEVLKWDQMDIAGNVGTNPGYQNWLYVKKGGTGVGTSWSDPLPDINTAITKAAALKSLNKTVNGILVAGGSGTDMLYSESFTVPANIKIYGGWKGDPGTELASTDVNGPHTSTARDLKDHKVYVATGTGNIQLPNASSALDGFVVRGSGIGSVDGLVTVSNASAWINAVEIDQQAAIASTYSLSLSGGIATNVLVARNNKGVSVSGTGKMVNATIAQNTAASVFNGSLLNSVYWGNSGTETTGGTISYCAFQGTVPAGTGNVQVNATNDIWFTANNIIPGPHFDLGATSGLARYQPGTARVNRSPMLRRGNKASFDSSLSSVITLADQYKKDINGNTRYHIAIDGATQVVDMGCYEDGTRGGFQLQWASDEIYVSSKAGYTTEMPLILPANDDPDINIGLSWTVEPVGTLNYCSLVNNPSSGSGSGVFVGSPVFTTTTNYASNSNRLCGKVKISTNLGAYLPDAELNVYQMPGTSSVWNDGYAGSFHKNNEVGARYITGPNTTTWSVRIIKGLDWIKIDDHDKDYGQDAPDAVNPVTGMGYKEVEEVFGGVIKNKTGPIKFRVGMKSKLDSNASPRYGLIAIIRSGGIALFFVRQGENADYLYRNEDPRTVGERTDAMKFSPYSLTDPNRTATTNGVDLGPRGGAFTAYPTMRGYYFKWNSTRGYLMKATTSTSNSTAPTAAEGFDSAREVCPPGYRHGTLTEWIHSVYNDVAEPAYTASLNPTDQASRDNFVWGRYADGYYDQLAPDPVVSVDQLPANPTAAQYPDVARKGFLMLSHYNYASIFFPATGRMLSTGYEEWKDYAMNHMSTSTSYFTGPGRNTHWNNDHIGVSCSGIEGNAAPVRCVKE